MNFLALLILSVLISVDSSNAKRDGTFHKNTKINGKNMYSLSPVDSVAGAQKHCNIVFFSSRNWTGNMNSNFQF